MTTAHVRSQAVRYMDLYVIRRTSGGTRNVRPSDGLHTRGQTANSHVASSPLRRTKIGEVGR
jgi:hypothetical protein